MRKRMRINIDFIVTAKTPNGTAERLLDSLTELVAKKADDANFIWQRVRLLNLGDAERAPHPPEDEEAGH